MTEKLIPIPESYFEYCKEKYGEILQENITYEELIELVLACGKIMHKMAKKSRGITTKSDVTAEELMNLFEEIADVRIMLEQFVYTKNIVSIVNTITETKLRREDGYAYTNK